MPPFSGFSVKSLFPTPLIIASFSKEAAISLNTQLTPLILAKERKNPSVKLTNIGGWQSEPTLQEWGGEPVSTVIEAIKDLIKQITFNIYEPQGELNVDWKVFGWANINYGGDFNILHTHAGAYWSAVYYVKTGDEYGQPYPGGELEIFDPRGVLPTMYNPQLRWKMKGFLSAGGIESHKPQDGQCIVFPSWLSHSVRTHTCNKARISLAFNFC